VRAVCRLASDHACTVLIHGESGTGKEMIARAIHTGGVRRARPFIAVDCSTLRDSLLESQLFGHVKGAFTGADQAAIGFFRAAHGGTLFLDEVGELDLRIQARLLRCLQERAVVPLGGTEPIPVDARILAATHRDLKAMVRAGSFREDLYYRLNVLCLVAPPLRERADDILLLANHFLAGFCADRGCPARHFSEEAGAALRQHAWPGNVRELANAVEHSFVLAMGTAIQVEALPEQLRLPSGGGDAGAPFPTLAAAERLLIGRALVVSGGNQARAAAMLQIGRGRLYRKIELYDLGALTHAVA
jgi:two-component system response regulator HydG